MKISTKSIFFILSFFLTYNSILAAFSDDDNYRKRHRYRGGLEKVDDDNNGHDNDDHLRPVKNQAYKETCGGCHFAYQPELLPSASWQKILGQLDDHFGEGLDIDSETLKNISDYLVKNGAEKSSAKRSVKIMRSLGNRVPIRISDIPYIREKHHELNPEIYNRKSVGSLGNCTACHTTAEKGIYEDDDVSIPE